MSISSIANTALSSLLNATQSARSGQGKFQQVQSEFQQLGQDLQVWEFDAGAAGLRDAFTEFSERVGRYKYGRKG